MKLPESLRSPRVLRPLVLAAVFLAVWHWREALNDIAQAAVAESVRLEAEHRRD